MSARPPMPTEEAIRTAFSPVQAEIMLALLPAPEAARDPALPTRQAAEEAGYSYDCFRRESAFMAARTTGAGRRPRWRRSEVLRIANNLKKTR